MATELKLNPRLDTAQADALRDTLRDAQGKDLVLDARDVEMLGAQCLELLLSARALWRNAGYSLSVANPTAHLEENLNRFGLTPSDLQSEGAT